jgi:hypothetical protein
MNKKFKTFLTTILVIFFSIPLTSQSIDRSDVSVDIFAGRTLKTELSLGLITKNLYWKRFGFYFIAHYFNTAYGTAVYGQSHINDELGWRTLYDTSEVKVQPWGMTIGATYRPAILFNDENHGLSFLLAGGWIHEQSQIEYNSTRYYQNKNISPTTLTISRLQKRTVTTLETLVNYEFIPRGIFSLSVTGGYNLRLGPVFGGCIGLRLRQI